MLKKNIYLLYPAGYHGNYVKWAIESSDANNKKVIDNPINTTTSTKFGGIGTSHHHARIPTHQSMPHHTWWSIYNKPQDYRIYLINHGLGTADISHDAANLLIQDPTGIVINLHDNDDAEWAAFGRINCVTKWPTYLATVFAWYFTPPRDFDPFDCAHHRDFRNFIVRNNFLGSCGKPDRAAIQTHIKRYATWFEVRNRYQPHEVNFDTYPPIPTLERRFFDFRLDQILSHQFPDTLQNLLMDLDVFDDVDCTMLRQRHDDYVKIQPNLPWFNSVRHWKRTGELDRYLLSHSVIQAEVLKIIFRDSGVCWPSQHDVHSWLISYSMIRDPSWPEIKHPLDFYDLDPAVREEINLVHGIQSMYGPTVRRDMLHLAWDDLSLESINEQYQRDR